MGVRRQIEVAGIVQGVGFRPYVYRLAIEGNLAGTVTNTSSGVTIEVEGAPEAVKEFVERLPATAPPLSRITQVSVRDVPCIGDREFRILASQRGQQVQTLISPDVATCPDCLREMLDPGDRRYRYPFINCTNCGPRFTIVRDVPYDRPLTSMAVFPMCPACRAEYDDPLNRRFHAQPNACWECGPRVELWDRKGKRIVTKDAIGTAASFLAAGLVVAVKGLGGFHLAVDATNATAVCLLRERKRRVEKPFAVMVPSLEVARHICEVDEAGEKTLQVSQRPIVLLPRRSPSAIAKNVAPGNHNLGIFLPYTPLHHLLFAEGGFEALVMTSGNLSEEPIAIDNQEAVARLSNLADCFLVHNREILLRCDDSVVRVLDGQTHQMRRSRGFVPVPVFLGEEVESVLAVGGELKNTVCLTKSKHAFLSQHVGDLENLASHGFFEEAVEHLQRILEIQPRAIAHDLHPDYFSTRWALTQKLPVVGVQHHHAHVASCMAENHLEGDVIGLALDGTGYGTDGHIWGGEVLVAGYRTFERVAHFEYVPLPGGEAAVREPWRMAVSYLFHHFGDSFRQLSGPFVRDLDPTKVDLIVRMVTKGVNSPLTSSCGRLFDAVAALVGLRSKVNYEAQAAIELEMAIGDEAESAGYPIELAWSTERCILQTKPMFAAIIDDLAQKIPVSVISQRFHNGLAETFCKVAREIRERTSLERVCLSGGTFHNGYLLRYVTKCLRGAGFDVYTQKEVPAGDGGLSLGQALVAHHQLVSS